MARMDFGRKNLVVYVTAGYPSMEATREIILKLQDTEVGAIELGVPYTDPVADGPVIAEASLKSLELGTNLDGIFEMTASLRGKIRTPLYLMSYYSPIFSYGEDRFIRRSVESGVTGSILPDLALGEGRELFRREKEAGLDPVLLVFPNTKDARVKDIAEETGSFIYFVNLFGTTGARADIPQASLDRLAAVRKTSGKPVFGGFGVSNRESYRRLAAVADGVIIGSAVVKLLLKNAGDPKELAENVAAFVREVLA